MRIVAPNPSAYTLEGTNTYVARGWVVDPGPRDAGHLEAVLRAAGGRIEGIAITHGHPDHDEGAPALAELAGGVPVVRPRDGEEVGPFRALATPGHAQDHVALVLGRVCFSGDAVLGAGSVFISADGGGLAAYLEGLERLRSLDLDLICPGHGPVVRDPHAKVSQYIEHRLDRERRLVAALDGGARTVDELLDRAWDDVPAEARPFLGAAMRATLAAHLDKLEAEGRLPAGVERPGAGA